MAENGVPKNDLSGNREELEVALNGLADAVDFVKGDAKTIAALSAIGRSDFDSMVTADAIEALEHVSCYLFGHITDLEMSVRAVQEAACGEGQR